MCVCVLVWSHACACVCVNVWVGGSECIGAFVILLWTGGCKML